MSIIKHSEESQNNFPPDRRDYFAKKIMEEIRSLMSQNNFPPDRRDYVWWKTKDGEEHRAVSK